MSNWYEVHIEYGFNTRRKTSRRELVKKIYVYIQLYNVHLVEILKT